MPLFLNHTLPYVIDGQFQLPVYLGTVPLSLSGVLQSLAVYCSALQLVAAYCSVLPYVAVSFNVLQYVAECCICAQFQLPVYVEPVPPYLSGLCGLCTREREKGEKESGGGRQGEMCFSVCTRVCMWIYTMQRI